MENNIKRIIAEIQQSDLCQMTQDEIIIKLENFIKELTTTPLKDLIGEPSEDMPEDVALARSEGAFAIIPVILGEDNE